MRCQHEEQQSSGADVGPCAVDHILVLDNERLYNELLSDLPKEGLAHINIVKLSKSGGVINRDELARNRERLAQVKQYFYGVPGEDLHPFSYSIPISVLRVYKIGAPPVPSSCLPIGADVTEHETQLVPVNITTDLLHKCLSVPDCPPEVSQRPSHLRMPVVNPSYSLQILSLSCQWKSVPGADLLTSNALGFIAM